MPPANTIWSDSPPPPLPSYPPAAPNADEAESARWFLVSLAGRASVRIRDRFVVGAGSSCDLSLAEWGIAPNHAMLTVEGGELYITPLSDAPTLVDGQVLQERLRLGPHSALSFGELEFGVQFEAPESPRWDLDSQGSAEASLPPLEPVAGAPSPRVASPGPQSSPRPDPRPHPRRGNVVPISAGIAVSLIVFGLWFYRADQWPAQFAQSAVPSSQVPAVTEPNAPLEVVSAEQPAPDADPTAASQASDVMLSAVQNVPDAAADASVPPTVPDVAPPPSRPEVPAVSQQVPQELVPEAPMQEEASPPPEQQPTVAEAAAPIPEATQEEPRAGEELPYQGERVAEVAALKPEEARLEPPRDLGPPLIFVTSEVPPLVDVAALSSADARVRPPWSDQPVAPGPYLPAPVFRPEVEAVAPVPPAADRVAATSEAPVTAARGIGRPPLIFVQREQALVDIAALSRPVVHVTPPLSDIPVSVANAASKGAADRHALSVLMAEADARYSQGDLVTPPHQSAAELYVKALRMVPKLRIAHTRLNNIVGWIALDATDMLGKRRPEDARQILARLSAAVPKDQRDAVDAAAMRRWRVAGLLLEADALIQKHRIAGPARPNAVSQLREALKIDRHNAMAEEMLARALDLVASVPNR
jgi:hypothetical protein